MRRTLCAWLAVGIVVILGAPRVADARNGAPDGPTWAQTAAGSAAFSAQARARHQWNSLARLPADDRIAVVTRRLRTLHGRFVRYSPEDITLFVGGEFVTVARPDVLEVLWHERSHQMRNALASLGAGLAMGALAGAGCDAARDRDAASLAASRLSLRTGTATHAALRPYPVIYRAPSWDERER